MNHATSGTAPAAEHALVVDSFLVDNGWVRDLDRHQERFSRSCGTLGLAVEPEHLKRFLVAAAEVMPSEGRWFPRFEAHAGDPVAFVCWLRPAPALTTSVRLWVYPEPDPRSLPRIKGPDLAVLAELRSQAGEHEADDAVLLSPTGVVLETAHSGLLWWRGDVLCYPDPALPVLPSVTARRVVERAEASGFVVRPERCNWPELASFEVWAVNALHGIRPVTAWRDSEREVIAPPVAESRLSRFWLGEPGADNLCDVRVDERNGPSPP